MRRLDWVEDVRVRLREDGEVLSGEIFVVPRDESEILNRVEQASQAASQVDWRLHDLNIVPVRSINRNGG